MVDFVSFPHVMYTNGEQKSKQLGDQNGFYLNVCGLSLLKFSDSAVSPSISGDVFEFPPNGPKFAPPLHRH